MNFGTGAVKITPAHDPNDFECGKRHGLEFINVFTDDGLINENGGQFKGLKRFDARVEVIKALKNLKLFKDTKDNKMSIGVCSRSKDIVEPLLKPQWYLDQKEVATEAIRLFKESQLKIFPTFLATEWTLWLEKVAAGEDWCISRQLWWGHRIPAYLAWKKDSPKPSGDDRSEWLVAKSQSEALQLASQKLGVPESEINVEQDEDVLDTWFSSGLFPFSVFGWPEKTADLEKFYPTSLLETGRDILFFWVARMVMFGLELTGKLPFHTVFLHAMVRDASGRKMSKSLGNVIDPIDVIEGITLPQLQEKLKNSNLPEKELKQALEDQKKNFPAGIKQCGTDALRFALCDYTSHGRDINLNVQTVEGYRMWCNKIWNATKFVLGVLGEDFKPLDHIETPVRPIDKWILSRLAIATKSANKGFKTYSFSLATQSLHTFWLSDFCDVYVEAVKPIVYGERKDAHITLQTLYTCLDTGLRLLHPFMPFLTEELFNRLPRRHSAHESLVISPYTQILHPDPNKHADREEGNWNDLTTSSSIFFDGQIEAEFAYIEKINREIRAAKSLYMKGNVKKQDPPVYVQFSDPERQKTFEKLKEYSNTLVWCSDIKVLTSADSEPEGCSLTVVDDSCKVFVELSGLGLDYNGEIKRLEKSIDNCKRELGKIEAKMSAPKYEEKVPEEIRNAAAQRKATLLAEIEITEKGMQLFKKLLENK